MRFGIYLALLAAVGLPAALGPAARRLSPRSAAVVLTTGALGAGLVWVAALALLALATVGRLGLVGSLGHWSVAVIEARDPVPVAAGLASMAGLVFVTAALAESCRRLGRGLMQLGRLHLRTTGRRCGDVAVIDDATPEALALPGWRGSVVVTSGMLKVLEPAERRVLLAHERSHLRNRHWVFRMATRLGAALLPTARPLVARCDQALERWADEDAADAVGDRHLVATAVARAALATTEHHRSALAQGFSDGAVTERVETLLAPRGASRWTLATVPAGIAVVAVVTVFAAAQDLEGLFEAARRVWPG
jgi:Zn-dependent protease with chaperone function